MNVQRVWHKTSDRIGWAVQDQRRFGRDGTWVVWDEHARRPTWHPWVALHPWPDDAEVVIGPR